MKNVICGAYTVLVERTCVVLGLALLVVACGASPEDGIAEEAAVKSQALLPAWTWTGPEHITDKVPAASVWDSTRETALFWSGVPAYGSRLYYSGHFDGEAWTTPLDLGGFIGAPAATSWGWGRFDVFAHGTKGPPQGRPNVWHTWFDANLGIGWGSWEDLGSYNGYGFVGGSQVATVETGSNRLMVFAVGNRPDANNPRQPDTSLDSQIYQISYSPDTSWTFWSGLGGSIRGSFGLAAVSTQDFYVDIYTIWSDRQVYTRRLSNAWLPWVSIGAPPAGLGLDTGGKNSVAAAVDSTGNPVVFVHDAVGNIYQRTYPYNTGWTLIDNSKSTAVGTLTAVKRGSGIDLYALHPNGSEIIQNRTF